MEDTEDAAASTHSEADTMVVEQQNSRRSAQITVLMNDELLERIVGSLPTNKLYTVEQVCRKWQAVIKSDRFQQALFIKPVAPVLAYWFRNPKNPVQGSWSTSDTELIPTRVFVNPFIKKHPELFSTDPPRPAYKRGAPTEMKIGLSSYAKGRLMSSKMKRMLVTQPPLAWIRFARTQGALRYPCGSQIAWYNEDHMSVTMQQLATEVPLGDNLEFLGGEHFEELACAADLEALRSSEDFN